MDKNNRGSSSGEIMGVAFIAGALSASLSASFGALYLFGSKIYDYESVKDDFKAIERVDVIGLERPELFFKENGIRFYAEVDGLLVQDHPALRQNLGSNDPSKEVKGQIFYSHVGGKRLDQYFSQ